MAKLGEGTAELAIGSELDLEELEPVGEDGEQLQWMVGIKSDLAARLPLYSADWACDRLSKVWLEP